MKTISIPLYNSDSSESRIPFMVSHDGINFSYQNAYEGLYYVY